MDTLKTNMARQIAEAASDSQAQRTGLTPQSVNVVLCEDTLVITLHGTLSPAEKALTQTAAGAAQVQEFHRLLFATSSEPLRQKIKLITGVDVLEVASEVSPAMGAVVHTFANGTMVQVFHLAKKLPVEVSSIATPKAAD